MSLVIPQSTVSKPIFEGEMITFSKFDRIALRELVNRIDRPVKRILEVGSWLGTGSTTTIIEALRGDGEAILYCVDTWRGSVNVERHQKLVAQYDVLGTFLHNVRKIGGEALVKPLIMSSRDAASIVADESFDLVFIDAEHSYLETSRDIQLWMPKVRKGGVLCGHDCEMRAENAGLLRLRENMGADTIEGNEQFSRIHPGVILATYEQLHDRHNLWTEKLIDSDDGERGCATIWDITC